MLRSHKTLGRCSTSPARPQSFETLPIHFIPWHSLPTHPSQSPRYLRCPSFLSCRVACSPALHTTSHGFFSWGTHSPGRCWPRPPPLSLPPGRAFGISQPTVPSPPPPHRRRPPLGPSCSGCAGRASGISTSPVTATPRPVYTTVTATATPWSHPLAWAGTGHVVTTSSCCGETACPPGSRNGPGPGRNASPQDLESITVGLPWGTGHGKGPCSAQADSDSLSRPRHAPSGAD